MGTGNINGSNYAVDLRARDNTTSVSASSAAQLATSASITPSSSPLIGVYWNKSAQDDLGVLYLPANALAASAVPVATAATTTKVTGVVSRTDAAKLQYQLATIPANMAAGTYVVFIQATKKSVAGVVPKAMSMALKTFNVGQPNEEKRIAFGCPDCHSTNVWHDNAVNGANGNHPARFDPDYCASCHDYDAPVAPVANGAAANSLGGQSWKVTHDSAGNEVYALVNGTGTFPAGSGQAWVGGGNKFGYGTTPISRRVHGVHASGIVRTKDGSPMINYPYEIYPGENVSITFPQDVKNCEKCHTSATSGTWKTKPGRLACLGCHDSDAAYAHAAIMTLDSTPAIGTTALVTGTTAATAPTSGPFSSDEVESCPVCHASK